MACYKPLKGYRSRELNPSGKRGIVFSASEGFQDMKVDLACGQCIGCRLERSRQWAVRCVHEASLYEDNCFVTLTFDDEHLPKDKSVNVRDFQLFMKRLRKKKGPGVRFFHCGEYGEKFSRPHYHACLFNCDFVDKQVYKIVNENKLYVSEELSELWPFGFSTIGDVNFDSAAYVARYVLKKRTGPSSLTHYNEIDFNTGEILSERRPEYVSMSRRPGIGKKWYESFKSDLYPKDFITLNGVKFRPPRYYDSQFEIEFPEELAKIKGVRKTNGSLHADNNTPERLEVREEVQFLRAKFLKRSFEDGT